jgi:hypothetical protein
MCKSSPCKALGSGERITGYRIRRSNGVDLAVDRAAADFEQSRRTQDHAM